MAKSKSSYIDEYRKARKNLLQNIRRLEKRGYDVSKIKIPDIPKRITQKSIKKLKEINEQRYNKATKTRIKFNPKTGKEEKITEKGLRAKYHEKVESTRKAIEKRKENKNRRIIEDIHRRNEDYVKQGYRVDWSTYKDYETREIQREVLEGNIKEEKNLPELYDIDEQTGEIIPKKVTEIDIESGEYYYDASTGEIFSGDDVPESDRNRPYIIALSQQETREKIYTNALNELDIMIQYEGTSNDSDSKIRATHANAQAIKDFVMSEYEKDPYRVAQVLKNMMDNNNFHSVDYMYRTGGYSKFLSYYETSFGMYDETTEYTEEYDDEEY